VQDRQINMTSTLLDGGATAHVFGRSALDAASIISHFGRSNRHHRREN
jgi:hypothetical protein